MRQWREIKTKKGSKCLSEEFCGQTLSYLGTYQGPMLWLFKYFRQKNRRKNWRFCLKTKLNYAQNLIITLVFEKSANFFAENGRKSQKIVIITSTPGHPARHQISFRSHSYSEGEPIRGCWHEKEGQDCLLLFREKKNKEKRSTLKAEQGDQIGRIFAFWVTVYYG
jgi:hypothetical protein